MDACVSAPAPRVLVLGGAGFIGRHAVAALLGHGLRPIVGSRRPGRAGGRLPPDAHDCPRREVHVERLLEPADWLDKIADVDVVLNCVGILRQRGRETYERVHHLGPAALAAACRERGVRLVHVSALGLSADARSRFIRSKRAGDDAIRASGANACIVRPSLLDADCGGYGASWLRRVARWPVHPLPAGATGRIAALDVRDLGEALARLVLRSRLAGADGPDEFELGGAEAFSLREYVARLRSAAARPPARYLPLPDALVRAGSHLCDLLHVTPFSFGHWELLQRDNRPARADLARLLGRPPRRIGGGEDAVVPAPAPAYSFTPCATPFLVRRS